MRKALDRVLSAQSLASTVTGPACGLDQDFGYSIQAIYSTAGTLAGTFKLQASLNYNPGTPQSGGAYNAGDWADIDGSSVLISGAGTWIWEDAQAMYPWVRLVYTAAGGDSGSLTQYFFTRGF